ECEDDPEQGPGDRKEDGLKSMEANETLLVERLQHQKNNRRDDGHVGQRAGHVIVKSGGYRCGHAHAPTLHGTAGTLCTGRSIRDLRSTGCTKSHRSLL